MPGSEDRIAQAFHEAYERLAPDFGYKTREASAKPWEQVPENNRALMAAVVRSLLDNGIISDHRSMMTAGRITITCTQHGVANCSCLIAPARGI